MSAEYDYVVVGSGAGGGPVAARLAKAGMKVLLLEAGSDAEPPDYQVPVFHPQSTEDPQLRWEFFVRHYADDAVQKRDPKYIPEKDGVFYPRAGTLGGCTAHNALITIYPSDADWDGIAEITGDGSWRAANMRKYFQGLENCKYRPLQRLLSYLGINPSRHGFRGWLSTEIAVPPAALEDSTLARCLARSALDALKQLGHDVDYYLKRLDTLWDPNDRRLGVQKQYEGLCYTPLATAGHARNGTRELLRETARTRPDRLTIKTNCLVTRVLFDASKTAVGVEYMQGDALYEAAAAYDPLRTPEKQTVIVKREVILAAGAFNTPQLLLLSGVGPAADLAQHGIETQVDLPGVGANLQDRYEVGVVNRMKFDWWVLKGAEFRAGDALYEMWAKRRFGLYTSNGAVLGIIKRSSKAQAVPDLFMFALLGLFRGYFPGYSELFAKHHNYLTWAILKAHTRNTAGRVRLRSADPRRAPEIVFNYFDANDRYGNEDLDAVVEAVKFVRLLEPALAGYVDAEELPGKDVQSDAEIAQYVKDTAWGHHASCTCPMMPREQGGVLDSEFRVYGTRNLRVVDASMFPKIPGYFIVTSIYVAAEKAGEVILRAARRSSSA